jgi:hypothetical protein
VVALAAIVVIVLQLEGRPIPVFYHLLEQPPDHPSDQENGQQDQDGGPTRPGDHRAPRPITTFITSAPVGVRPCTTDDSAR